MNKSIGSAELDSETSPAPLRKGLVLAASAALLHCVLVTLGASGILLFNYGPLGEVLAYYSVVTGAERGFGFFAPSVTDQPRVRFELMKSGGEVLSRTLEQGLSAESAIRVGHFESEIFTAMKPGQEDIRRALVASLAGKMFAQYPGTEKVKVSLEIYTLVSMPEYRNGLRPQWKTAYQATFAPSTMDKK